MADITNGTIEVVLGGTPVKAQRYTTGMYMKFREWVRDAPVKESLELIKDLPREERVPLISEIHKGRLRGSELEKAIEDSMESVEGLVHILWQCFHPVNPAMTEEDVMNLWLHSSEEEQGPATRKLMEGIPSAKIEARSDAPLSQ